MKVEKLEPEDAAEHEFDDGDEDGILETSDFDGFYSQCGYVPCSEDQADIMLYKTGSDSDPYNPEGITHAARYVPGVCAWHWESKCGSAEKIRHMPDAQDGYWPDEPDRANYGSPYRYYKLQN